MLLYYCVIFLGLSLCSFIVLIASFGKTGEEIQGELGCEGSFKVLTLVGISVAPFCVMIQNVYQHIIYRLIDKTILNIFLNVPL